MLRKPQCDYGWDWNIALAPLGVYGRIALIGGEGEIAGATHPPAPRRRPRPPRDRRRARRLRRRRTPPGTSPSAGPSTPAPPAATPATGRLTATLTIDHPELWWPAGHGDQPLHELVVTAGRPHPHASRSRSATSASSPSPTPSAAASSSSVNGRDIFARGSNWIPADALPGRITDAETRAPPAIRRRRQHQPDPRLGRRPLRARLLLRELRRPRPPRLAGLHVRLPSLSGDRRIPRRGRARGRLPVPPPRPPRRPLVRRQRAPRRAHLVRGIAQEPRPLPRRLRPPQPHHRDRAEAARSPAPSGGRPAPRPARCPSATPGTTTPPATCTSGRSGTRAATSSTTATSARASAPSSASSPTPRCR